MEIVGNIGGNCVHILKADTEKKKPKVVTKDDFLFVKMAAKMFSFVLKRLCVIGTLRMSVNA